MDLVQYVGTRIRELRSGYGGEGMSQESLAKQLGAATNTVSRWETGTYRPSLDDLEQLSRFFGVSILTFFPNQNVGANERLSALLRAAEQLPEEDIDELRRYAEFRRARTLYAGGKRPQPGRKRKQPL